MNQFTRTLPLILAAALQLLPLLRNLATSPAAGSSFAIILRWGIGMGAALGAVDAVSGATSMFATTNSFSGSIGTAFTDKVTVSIGGGSQAAANDYFILSSGATSSALLMNGQSTTVTLPPGLKFTASWVNGASTIGGVISGTPTTAGSYPTTVTVVSPGNASLSQAITITISGSTTPTAPAITTQPAAATVIAGKTATLTAAASGTAPVGLFWLKNGSPLANGGNISGANTAKLTIASVAATDAGNYSLLASNSVGTATSSAAALTVISPPAITSQPAAQAAAAGGSTTFSVTATGSAPLNYFWRINGTNIANGAKYSGVNTSALNITGITTADAGNYSVIVTNLAGSVTSSVAPLTVVASPTITTPPANLTVTAGAGATFSVTAAGSTPLGYHWLKNGAPLANGGNVSGATTATLTLTAVTAGDAAGYSVTVTNSLGSVTSPAATLTVISPPAITSPPAAQTVTSGGNAQFAVTATGSAPLNYRWLKNGGGITNGVKFSGVNSNVLTITAAGLADAGNYSVIITNLAGSVTSSAAPLAVVSTPAFITLPVNQTVAAGTGASFTASAVGSAPLVYQWSKNGAALADGGNISGSATATLLIATASTGDAGNYSLTVTSSLGSITSPAVTLTVAIPPAIVTPPANATVPAGSNVTFTVTASGSATLNYQWRKNGNAIANGGNASGATGNTLTLANVSAADAANYSVTVTNAVGTATSSSATLTVIAPPSITSHPANLTVAQGGSASFAVTATGTGPLVFQWLKDGVAIPGANSNILVLSSVTTNHAGNYFAVVTNTVGSVASSSAALTVMVPPVILTQPADATVVAGNGAAFTVTASSSMPLTYQWRKNGVNIPGAVDATFTLAAASATDAANYSVVIATSGGTATSRNAVLTVQSPPVITEQPASQASAIGNPATLTVVAAGTGPLAYQWFKGGLALIDDGNIAGSATSTLNITVLTTNELDTYFVVVSNFLGTVTSANASLSANVSPIITVPPASQTVAAGSNVTLAATATGSGPLGWQWLKNGAKLANSSTVSGATSPTLTLANVTTGNSGNYSVVVTNLFGKATSPAATLTVQVAPRITASPVNLTAKANTTVTFNVTAAGTATLFYQWFKDDLALTDGGNIAGATTRSLKIATLTTNDAGSYSVIVTNAVGSATSRSATLTVLVPPAIVTQPASQSVTQSNAVTFTVEASGTATLRYQWRKNGGNISGATAASYTIAAAKTTDAAYYSVVVANSAGSITSANARLIVNVPPSFTASPVNLTAKANTTVTFNVTAAGTATLFYQWFKDDLALTDGGNIAGATTRSLKIATLTTNDAGSYSVIVTNAVGSATSRSATLTVLVPPAIVTQPASQSVTQSNAVTFTVEASGTATLRYQWRKNGGNISGATAASYTIAAAKTTDAAYYSVVVANSAGSITSANARLIVNVPPSFILQPASRTATNGTTTVFKATVKGTAPFSYQWFKNGNPLVDGGKISGALSNILTVANLTTSDAGAYALTVSNLGGSITSSPATLKVVRPKSSEDDDEHDDNSLTQSRAAASIVPDLPPIVANLVRNADGSVTLDCSGTAASNYILQTSSNLTEWINLSTNTVPVGGQWQVNDPEAAKLPCRFYRLTTP